MSVFSIFEKKMVNFFFSHFLFQDITSNEEISDSTSSSERPLHVFERPNLSTFMPLPLPEPMPIASSTPVDRSIDDDVFLSADGVDNNAFVGDVLPDDEDHDEDQVVFDEAFVNAAIKFKPPPPPRFS